MGALSKSIRVCFEICNELYTAIGAGVLGMVVLIQHGFKSHQTIKNLTVVGLTAASLIFVFSRERERISINKKNVIIITGCDSGWFNHIDFIHLVERSFFLFLRFRILFGSVCS